MLLRACCLPCVLGIRKEADTSWTTGNSAVPATRYTTLLFYVPRFDEEFPASPL